MACVRWPRPRPSSRDRGSEAVARAVDHPAYPLAVAAAHRVRGGNGPTAWQTAAQVASTMVGGLLVVPLYLFALELHGTATAWLACVLSFLVPLTGHVLVDVLSEGSFFLLDARDAGQPYGFSGTAGRSGSLPRSCSRDWLIWLGPRVYCCRWHSWAPWDCWYSARRRLPWPRSGRSVLVLARPASACSVLTWRSRAASGPSPPWLGCWVCQPGRRPWRSSTNGPSIPASRP